MSQSRSQSDDVVATIREDVGEDVDIHDSSNPDAVFLTTRSKMELALRKYKSGLLAKAKWVNPFVIMSTFLSVLLVTDFKSVFGFSQGTWEAVFLMGFLISSIWLLICLYEYIENRHKADTDYVIKELESDKRY